MEEFKKQARQETIKFYNATPTYRTAEEFCAFIDSLIDKTVQMTEKRVIERIKQDCSFGECELPNEGESSRDYFFHLSKSYFQSLITNKSDINKLTE